jgi:hypothetical protein
VRQIYPNRSTSVLPAEHRFAALLTESGSRARSLCRKETHPLIKKANGIPVENEVFHYVVVGVPLGLIMFI